MSGIKLLKSVKNTTILQNTLLRGSVSQIRNASNLPKDVKTHTGQVHMLNIIWFLNLMKCYFFSNLRKMITEW